MTENITDTVDTTTPNNSSSDDNKKVEKKRSRIFRRNPINDYRKERMIGEGTFANVYEGVQISTGRKVAIKKIKMRKSNDGFDLTAIREIKFLQELKHPNIIELIEVFSKKTNLNLVLEYLDSDLEMIIKAKDVVFSVADIKSWMIMTLRGLYHCHRSFVLHRDLKPNNLLISSTGQLKLADFGLSRDYGESDPNVLMTSQVVTRWYRAPELLFGAKKYGYSVDMWSVGCIFAELMLRTPYLPGDSDLNQLDIIFRALGTPTEEIWPGMKSLPYLKSLPPEYEFPIYMKTPWRNLFTAAGDDALDLLEKMLTYNPSKRISAKEALLHPYFRNKPRPTDPSDLPRCTKEDLNSKKRKHEEGEEKLSKRLFV